MSCEITYNFRVELSDLIITVLARDHKSVLFRDISPQLEHPVIRRLRERRRNIRPRTDGELKVAAEVCIAAGNSPEIVVYLCMFMYDVGKDVFHVKYRFSKTNFYLPICLILRQIIVYLDSS